jgi:hypothetical protein
LNKMKTRVRIGKRVTLRAILERQGKQKYSPCRIQGRVKKAKKQVELTGRRKVTMGVSEKWR